MFSSLLFLLLASFTSAQNAETYSAKLNPLLVCYDAWCGDGWSKSAQTIRYSQRPNPLSCRAANRQVEQDGANPLILPPDSANRFQFLIFSQGNAYMCDVSKVAIPTCLENRFDPCELRSKWSFITFSIPAADLNLSENLDLRLVRHREGTKEHFAFQRAVGNIEAGRQRSMGKRVCELSNTTANGKKLQDFMNNLLKKEASNEAFENHVRQMKISAKEARIKETRQIEGERDETSMERIKRFAVHLTTPYSSKSKPVAEEEIEKLKNLYSRQLKKCAEAKGLESTALSLLRNLEGETPEALLPLQRVKSVK